MRTETSTRRRTRKPPRQRPGRGATNEPEGTRDPGAPRYSLREGHVLLVDDATSARMALVRQRGTAPELVVRGLLTALGHRFRLRNRDLPGSPDIANRRQRWAVFVHGCFWHRHGCKATTTPGNNRAFWEAKFERNVARDRRTQGELEALGYRVLVVWECETKARSPALLERLRTALTAAGLERPRGGGGRSPPRPPG
jgi:DNA mismatch endonuclease (patch repair protein)